MRFDTPYTPESSESPFSPLSIYDPPIISQCLTFGRTEALVDGASREHSRSVDPPIEEKHHNHGYEKGAQRRINNISRVIGQLADPRTLMAMRLEGVRRRRAEGRFTWPWHFSRIRTKNALREHGHTREGDDRSFDHAEISLDWFVLFIILVNKCFQFFGILFKALRRA